MRKGADSSRYPSANHASRGVRHPRRRDTVWLVTGVTPGLAMSDQPHHTAGALALDPETIKPEVELAARRCALIVERNPELAQALARALQMAAEPAWLVRYASDTRLLASSPQNSGPEVIVLDASWPDDDGASSYQNANALPELQDAQMIFVTPDTSYQLSQRGISSGVILRQWRNPDDIVALVSEALFYREDDI